MAEAIRDIQKKCLGILAEIDRVCRRAGIKYSLCGGSVIGYKLYKGFIPWDDDIDLMMTRENYDRFLEVFPAEADPRYALMNYATAGEERVAALFSRVEDRETSLHERIAGSRREGRVFIDVTVFDDVRGPLDLKLARLRVGWTCARLYKNNGMIPGTGWKRRAAGLVPGNRDAKSRMRCYARADEFCRRRSRRGAAPWCAELLSSAYGDIIYEKRVFDEYDDILFDGVPTMIIRDWEDYLFMRYGRREFTADIPEQEKSTHLELE